MPSSSFADRLLGVLLPQPRPIPVPVKPSAPSGPRRG